jgi:hypothetical protein
MAKAVRKTGKKKEKKNIAEGVAHIQSTFNNTIVTITDLSGNVIAWASSGHPVCGADGGRGCREKGKGTRAPKRSGLRQGAGLRSGIGIAIPATGGAERHAHPGCDADSAQRLPTAEATAGVTFDGRKG